jgi:2-polyprenyl-6-methoxyphenol hydroxylase-like FAD-dependent oxidoreductase
MRAIDQAPELPQRVRTGKRESRFMGTSDLPNFFRKPYGAGVDGDGWALVGGAGYHKDPLTAEGIADAFRGAAMLAQAIDSGKQPLAQALSDYEAKRNELAMPIYELTLERAGQEPPPPEFVQLLLALPGNQEQTNRFFGVDAGTVRPQDFFAPENIGAIMAAA